MPTDGTAAQGPAAARHVVAVVDEQSALVDIDRLERVARHVLERLAVPLELELSVTCVDVVRMRELNRAHMGANGPTDVLAFPIDAVDQVAPGVPGLLGDVVLCPQVAYDQAAEHGRTGDGELDLLLVHGVLHLLGHDHAEADERAQMFALTDELLAAAPVAGGRSR